jgi:hypothetical protein
MINNGDFSQGWEDMPPAPGHLINQRPHGWALRWIEPGQPLFESGDRAGGVPECVHKLSGQLPPNEQFGGRDALILSGEAVYKIFHSGAAFGAELSQTLTGLQPGSEALLTVPVLAVLHGETDDFGAESGVWVNGVGTWVNGATMGNRRWHRHVQRFTVPDDGRATIAIRVKSKWPRPKDFFIDNVSLEAIVAPGPAPLPEPPPLPGPPPLPERDPVEPVPPMGDETAVRVVVPPGLRLVVAESDEAGVVVVVVPRGRKVVKAA